MTFLLDTNTCIRYLNGTSDSIRGRVAAFEARDITLCSVVKAELIFGAQKSARPEANLNRLPVFFNRFISLPFDDAAARAYGEIRAQLERAGTPIGPNDLLIAAIARENRMTLVTHNTDEFERVEGLKIEDWE